MRSSSRRRCRFDHCLSVLRPRPIEVVALTHARRASAAPMRLLAHIAFHDHATSGYWQEAEKRFNATGGRRWVDPTQRLDMFYRWTNWSEPGAYRQSHPKILRRLKSDTERRDRVYKAVLTTLREMDERYVAHFAQIHAVIDANAGNMYVARLREFAARLQRVHAEVRVHSNLQTNYHLPWAHRAPMEAKLDEFDWFLYAEDDTFVPIAAMRQQLRLAEPLYREQGKLLSFARVANDSKGKLYFADLGSRQNVSHLFRFRDMSFGSMTFSFAASWAYPKRIMRDFVRSEQWRVPVDTRDLRASAGWGYVRPEMCTSRQQTIQPCQGCPGCAVLPYPSPDAAVYHLTQCGDWYVRQVSTMIPFDDGYGWACVKDRKGRQCTRYLYPPKRRPRQDPTGTFNLL